MKILVPTDFSPFAKVGALYAAHLAKELHAELLLIHVIHLETLPIAHAMSVSETIENEIEENVSASGASLIEEIRSHVRDVNISFKWIHGFPIEEAIETFAVQNGINLIVIGSKGASGIKKVIFGNNAVAIMNSSSVPVIIVPESSRFRKWDSIVYATDIHHIEEEIKSIIPFALQFGSTIHILHILPLDSKEKVEPLTLETELTNKLGYPKLKFTLSYAEEVVEGIDHYVAEEDANLLILFTHKFTFFEKIFNKSVSREIAFHSQTPLLVIKH